MPSSTIELSFRYTEQDYVRAMQAHFASRLRLPLEITALVLAAVVGGYLLRQSDTRAYGLALMGLSGILALMLIAAMVVIPRLVFRREAKFRDEYTLSFSPEGIHFETVRINSDLQWSIYSDALVDSRSFVLYYGPRSFTVVPKRVFQTPEQLSAFEQLLAQHIPKIVRR